MTTKPMIDAITYRGNRLILAWYMARASYYYSRRYDAGVIAASIGAVGLFIKFAKRDA